MYRCRGLLGGLRHTRVGDNRSHIMNGASRALAVGISCAKSNSVGDTHGAGSLFDLAGRLAAWRSRRAEDCGIKEIAAAEAGLRIGIAAADAHDAKARTTGRRRCVGDGMA